MIQTAVDFLGLASNDGQANEYIYDVWGRLRLVNNQSADPVTAYRYNGLNWRIAVQHDDDADGDLDANDLTYYHVYDERWRMVATFRDDDSDPKEQFVYHNAGNDGRGSASYIDDVILRDKDANTDWDVQADGTLEERFYYLQNWRHDVVALVDANGGGMRVEQVRYEAYGVPSFILAGDVNSDCVGP